MGFLFKRSQRGPKSLLPPPPNHEKDPWKPIKESPQYKLGLIHRFVDVWALETRPHMKDYEFPQNEEGKTPKNIHNNLKKFLKQVRESRGYDVDWRPPAFVRSPFSPFNKHYIMKTNPRFKQCCIDRANFVIDEINAHAKAQKHEKC